MFKLGNQKSLHRRLLHLLKAKKLLALHPKWIFLSYTWWLGFLLSVPNKVKYGFNHSKSLSTFIGTARYF